jgi:hypothetical protein
MFGYHRFPKPNVAAKLRPRSDAADRQKAQCPDVRFGSKADIETLPPDVRFTPKSGHHRAS